MKIVAICALLIGLAAAITGIVVVVRRSIRRGKADKTAIFLISACGVFSLVAAFNLYLVLRFL